MMTHGAPRAKREIAKYKGDIGETVKNMYKKFHSQQTTRPTVSLKIESVAKLSFMTPTIQ